MHERNDADSRDIVCVIFWDYNSANNCKVWYYEKINRYGLLRISYKLQKIVEKEEPSNEIEECFNCC